MQLAPDFREFVESFSDHEVRYLVVGGYALAAHGLPRATGDFDVWVWAGGDNAERVLAALTAFGFGSLGVEIAEFDRPDSIAQLGYPPLRSLRLGSVRSADSRCAAGQPDCGRADCDQQAGDHEDHRE